MKDKFAAEVAQEGDDAEIRAILLEVCHATRMGFVAVARVTEERWIAAQVVDRLEFGLNPGEELDVKKTICDDIRKCGQAIIIDRIADDPEWRKHPVPALYGFESYASIPIYLADRSFYGTLCAIDPEPRTLSGPETIALLTRCAARVAAILSEKRLADLNGGTILTYVGLCRMDDKAGDLRRHADHCRRLAVGSVSERTRMINRI